MDVGAVRSVLVAAVLASEHVDGLVEVGSLGVLEHPAPNLEPGDVVVLADGREALVTARVETSGGRFAALLETVALRGPRDK
jgi:hypothetical protein